uniref:(northern house mosquito) hypothetical protein n=1 Tax=Culex pipiens TaxID=7175 RepID=A0A8D8H690_CULPI
MCFSHSISENDIFFSIRWNVASFHRYRRALFRQADSSSHKSQLQLLLLFARLSSLFRGFLVGPPPVNRGTGRCMANPLVSDNCSEMHFATARRLAFPPVTD